MRTSLKLGIVGIGYTLAFLLSIAVVWVHVLLTSGPVAQASSGMYAFGDVMLFGAVFCTAALPPTAAVLFFLRHERVFWGVLASAGVVVAFTGVLAMIVFATGRSLHDDSLLGSWTAASVLRILAAPPFALVFVVCALIAPGGWMRRSLLAATAAEVLVSAYGAVIWFVPLVFGGR